jgi:hypothetical protein
MGQDHANVQARNHGLLFCHQTPLPREIDESKHEKSLVLKHEIIQF